MTSEDIETGVSQSQPSGEASADAEVFAGLDAERAGAMDSPAWVWSETPEEFVRQVAGLTHCTDEGYEPPGDWDDDHDCLNALIKRARQIRDAPLRQALAEALEDTAARKVETTAREIYEAWSSTPGWVPWVARGNSEKQEAARREARAAISKATGGAS